MNAKDFTSGLLIGAATGLIVGILTAPDKGSETVRKLTDAAKDRYDRMKGDAQDMANDVKSRAMGLADKGTNKAKDLLQDGKEKLDELNARANTVLQHS